MFRSCLVVKLFLLLPIKPNVIRVIKSRIRLVELETRSGTMRNADRSSTGTHKKKKPFGRPSHGWNDNIKMNLKEKGCYDEG